MGRRRIGAVGKMGSQVAVIADRSRKVLLQQIHIAAGKQRLGQPWALGKTRLHQRYNALLVCSVIPIPRQFHQQIKPSRAMLVSSVGQPLHLRRSEPLQLPFASRRIYGKAGTRRCIQACLLRQHTILLIRLRVVAGVIVGVAQAAQLRHSQGRFSAHRRQLGARSQRVSAQRMPQQDLLEQLLRLLRLPQRGSHLRLCQLITGPAS